MSPRPRDHAPKGFVTVREAAEILGVSEQAVRAKLNRGTLPGRIEHLQSGETRRYIPRDVLNRDGDGPATRDDTAELTMSAAILARDSIDEVVAEVRRRGEVAERQREKVFEEVAAIHKDMERADEERREMIQLLRESAEAQITHRKQARKRASERRAMSYAILACIVLLTILVAVDMLFFHIV